MTAVRFIVCMYFLCYFACSCCCVLLVSFRLLFNLLLHCSLLFTYNGADLHGWGLLPLLCCLFLHALLLCQVSGALGGSLLRIVILAQRLTRLATGHDVGDDVPAVRVLLQEASVAGVDEVDQRLGQVRLLRLVRRVVVPALQVLDFLAVALVARVVVGATSAPQQHIRLVRLHVHLDLRHDLLARTALALLGPAGGCLVGWRCLYFLFDLRLRLCLCLFLRLHLHSGHVVLLGQQIQCEFALERRDEVVIVLVLQERNDVESERHFRLGLLLLLDALERVGEIWLLLLFLLLMCGIRGIGLRLSWVFLVHVRRVRGRRRLQLRQEHVLPVELGRRAATSVPACAGARRQGVEDVVLHLGAVDGGCAGLPLEDVVADWNVNVRTEGLEGQPLLAGESLGERSLRGKVHQRAAAAARFARDAVEREQRWR
mmetsp:Transcript_28458/g.80129  ORF Transcript_28458/g.80129 Transcript_28458/m.80129 type:complete len:429 (+) Transcript_28458:92-1378(+)